jgi:queuine tRNA-ribosyltransferase
MKFKVQKRSKKSRARLGVLETSHGIVQTPCLVPVATQASVKTLTSEEAEETKSQILICNTFHLHLKPGEKIVNGLHQFMNWNRPLMTDSGGFQVFSLGFGRDSGVGKIFTEKGPRRAAIEKKQQPKQIKITSEGVYFKSPLDGSKLFLGPKESIKIQEKLGADIMFAFDECTSPLASKGYVEESLKRTHKWAEICLKTKKKKQALFGIVQGSHFKDFRQRSSEFINSLDFEGFGIGGDLGKDKETMAKILNWTIPNLEDSKPRHLLGIGYLEDMENIIKAGIDTFDCTVPTHYARRGVAFISKGELNLNQSKFLKDKKPLDSKCSCFVCQNYKRNYISHLIKAKEITGMKLLTFHNLYFFNTFVENIRKRIKDNKI